MKNCSFNVFLREKFYHREGMIKELVNLGAETPVHPFAKKSHCYYLFLRADRPLPADSAGVLLSQQGRKNEN